MSRFDRFLSAALLGLIAPVALFLLFWWGSILFAGEDSIMVFALIGLAAGVAIDLLVLKKFIRRLFLLPVPALACIGLFYSVLVYGFFMAFPLFNSVVGIVFCYIAAKRCVVLKLPRPRAKRITGRFCLFFFAVLAALCVISAVLALSEPDIESQLKNMIGLPFDVTMGMIWALILIGGTLLVLFQLFTSRLVAELVLKKTEENSGA